MSSDLTAELSHQTSSSVSSDLTAELSHQTSSSLSSDLTAELSHQTSSSVSSDLTAYPGHQTSPSMSSDGTTLDNHKIVDDEVLALDSEIGQSTNEHCQAGSVELDPVVNSGDLHQVVQLKANRGLTDYEKFYLLNNHLFPVLPVLALHTNFHLAILVSS